MSSGIRKQDAFIPSPEGEGNSRLFVKDPGHSAPFIERLVIEFNEMEKASKAA